MSNSFSYTTRTEDCCHLVMSGTLDSTLGNKSNQINSVMTYGPLLEVSKDAPYYSVYDT